MSLLKKFYKCCLCDHYFLSRESLKDHERKKHKDYSCDICKEKFTKAFNLKRHTFRKHSSEEKLNCSNCQVFFETKESLKKHKCQIQCTFCQKTFSTKSNCLKHERNFHTNPNQDDRPEPKKGKTFQCAKCKIKVKGAIAYDKHRAECNHSNKKRPHSDVDDSFVSAHKHRKTGGVTCRKCEVELTDYKDLYVHNMQVNI